MTTQRIMIVGGPGAGKTWLATRLSGICNVPVYCVDDAVYDQDGRLQPDDEIDRTVRAWSDNLEWIIEGGNTRTYADRVSRATLLIRLDPPRWLRVVRIAMRERCRRPILYWSWRYDHVFGPKDDAALGAAKSCTPTYRVRTRGDLRELLETMTERASV